MEKKETTATLTRVEAKDILDGSPRTKAQLYIAPVSQEGDHLYVDFASLFDIRVISNLLQKIDYSGRPVQVYI
jgi:hypothetical protein